MASGMEHVLEHDGEVSTLTQSEPDLGRVTLSAELEPGRPLRLFKLLAYHWSSQQSVDWLRDQVDASLESGLAEGFEGLAEAQREALDRYWQRADIEVEGDDELQQALRFAMFHVFQAAVRNEGRAIPAKGLTGSGYDGHAFWDTESFVLPVLTFTAPRTVRSALEWRHSTLDSARERARQLGLRGAALPWRTIHGEECSGLLARGHGRLPRERRRGGGGAALRGGHRRPRVRGAHRLRAARGERPAVGEPRLPRRARRLPDRRRDRARRVLRARGQQRLHEPDGAAEPALGRGGDRAPSRGRGAPRGRRRRAPRVGARGRRDVRALRRGARPAPAGPGLPRAPALGLREHPARQVPAAAALPVLPALPQAGGQAGRPRARHALARRRLHAASRSTRTSTTTSASPCATRRCRRPPSRCSPPRSATSALARDYLEEAARMDLEDLAHNTGDGLHMASLAGAVLAAVAGFGGVRDYNGRLSFRPRLPGGHRAAALLARGARQRAARRDRAGRDRVLARRRATRCASRTGTRR